MLTRDQLSQMSRIELQAYAKDQGIKANQKSERLVEELCGLTKADEVEDAAGAEAVVADEATDAVATTTAEQDDVSMASDLIMFTPQNPPAESAASAVEEPAAAEPAVEEAPVEEAPVERQEMVVEPEQHPSASIDEAQKEVTAESKEKAAHLKALEAAKRKLEEDKQREAASAARREAMAARQKARASPNDANDAAARATMAAMAAKLPKGAVPRVALLGAQAPAVPKPMSSSAGDRFAGPGSLYAQKVGPSVTAYADAQLQGTKPETHKGGLSFASGYADRFQGPDSRYRKGYRPSTMPIHDPKVYEAKQMDASVPLPGVAALAQPAEKREITPSNERFAGPESIYNAPAGPAVNAYDTSVKANDSTQVISFDKQTERFEGPDSIYQVPAGPAVNAYDTSVKANPSTLVNMDDMGYADRFAGPDSLYRKGLRQSTIPSQRDPSSFPKLGAQAGINKPAPSKAAKGAALRAALKSTIAAATIEEDSESEAKENAMEVS